MILSVLAQRAHLSYITLIFSAFDTYNCSRLNLTNKRLCSDWRQKPGEKWPILMTFFLTAIAAITGIQVLTVEPIADERKKLMFNNFDAYFSGEMIHQQCRVEPL